MHICMKYMCFWKIQHPPYNWLNFWVNNFWECSSVNFQELCFAFEKYLITDFLFSVLVKQQKTTKNTKNETRKKLNNTLQWNCLKVHLLSNILYCTHSIAHYYTFYANTLQISHIGENKCLQNEIEIVFKSAKSQLTFASTHHYVLLILSNISALIQLHCKQSFFSFLIRQLQCLQFIKIIFQTMNIIKKKK